MIRKLREALGGVLMHVEILRWFYRSDRHLRDLRELPGGPCGRCGYPLAARMNPCPRCGGRVPRIRTQPNHDRKAGA